MQEKSEEAKRKANYLLGVVEEALIIAGSLEAAFAGLLLVFLWMFQKQGVSLLWVTSFFDRLCLKVYGEDTPPPSGSSASLSLPISDSIPPPDSFRAWLGEVPDGCTASISPHTERVEVSRGGLYESPTPRAGFH